MKRLKELRERRDLSQVKLAAKADLNPATVNQIERGVRNASPGTLRKLAAALDVSLYELMEEDSPKAQTPLPLESLDKSDGGGEREDFGTDFKAIVKHGERVLNRLKKESEFMNDSHKRYMGSSVGARLPLIWRNEYLRWAVSSRTQIEEYEPLALLVIRGSDNETYKQFSPICWDLLDLAKDVTEKVMQLRDRRGKDEEYEAAIEVFRKPGALEEWTEELGSEKVAARLREQGSQ